MTITCDCEVDKYVHGLLESSNVIIIEYAKGSISDILKDYGYAGRDGASALDDLENYLRDALQRQWKKELPEYYKGLIEVNGKRIALFEVEPRYMPEGVLGMTDGFSTIWMRNDLNERFGYGTRKRVLRHEIAHIEDPFADEMTIRRRTNTEKIVPYSIN